MPRSGMGRVYKQPGSSVWWIDFSYRGKRHRESSESTRKKDATDLLKRRLAEMGSGRFVGRDAERVTFEDLSQMILSDYATNGRKSVHAVKASLKHLAACFGQTRAMEITTDRVTTYIEARQEDGAAAATIQKEISALKRMLSLAVRANRLPSKPYIPTVDVQNVREGFFAPAELERIVGEIREPLKPVVRFLALTGWRKSEALGLQWAQVDFDAGEVRLTAARSKNRTGRSFPFRVLPPLAELLEAQRERTRALEKQTGRIIPHVFHRDGEPIKDMRGAWDAACERAGVPGAWIHDLRRTAVRNMERAGVSRSVSMKLSGHKTEAVFRRYAIADSVALEEGVAKLALLHAAPAAPRKVLPFERDAAG
jgi:integrase